MGEIYFAILPDYVGLAFAMAGGGFALYQYFRNSERDRLADRRASALRAADEMKEFQVDGNVIVAQKMLDWEGHVLELPDDSGDLSKYPVTRLSFLLALRTHDTLRGEVAGYDRDADPLYLATGDPTVGATNVFTPQEEAIRDIMDGFLGRLERVESLIANGVITESNFEDYYFYWLQMIGDGSDTRPHTHLAMEKRNALVNYIARYEFRRVIRLFRRYGYRLA